MATKMIVSYDGTANEDDAIAFGSLLHRAGAEVSLGYVRHTDEAVSDEEAQEVLDRGAALLRRDVREQPRGDRSLDSRGSAGARRADRRAGGRVLLGLAHRAGPHHDRQLGRSVCSRAAMSPSGSRRSGWPRRAEAVRRIVAVGEAGGAGSAQATAQALASALGAEVVPVADDEADLLVIDSRADAEPGRVSLSSSAAHLIEIATCPVLVAAARRLAAVRRTRLPARSPSISGASPRAWRLGEGRPRGARALNRALAKGGRVRHFCLWVVDRARARASR